MKHILLGHDQQTGKEVFLPVDSFSTHVHMPGATGKGKTTAIQTMLYQLLRDKQNKACHIIVDFMGGLTSELLLWMASKYCPQSVRDRLVLIEPSRENVTLPMNPLLYDTLDHGFFKVNRATELILRAWESQNIGEMPRLARWLFNALWSASQLGLTVADTAHLLMPGSHYHKPLLNALPHRLRIEWSELIDARSAEAQKILESSRNRMKPFFESGILRNMFGSTMNRFDVLRFMQEKKIVILNLAPNNRISPQVANAIAGLALNEVLACARSLPKHVRYPTFLWLDEFQRMVTKDLEFAIPEVRQLSIKLILAHQSFSQLKQGDIDLTSIIWQPQTRIIFGEQGEDADLLAHELATLQFDPRLVKDEIYSIKQLQTGHKLVELRSWNTSQTDTDSWNQNYGHNWAAKDSRSHELGKTDYRVDEGTTQAHSQNRGEAGSRSTGHTESRNEQLIAELETIRELSKRTYFNPEELRTISAQAVRLLRTGSCLLKIVNDPKIYPVQVKAIKPGYLSWPYEVLVKKSPQVLERVQELIAKNFEQDFFVSPAVIEQETQERLEQVLRPKIILSPPEEDDTQRDADADPFGV